MRVKAVLSGSRKESEVDKHTVWGEIEQEWSKNVEQAKMR
jgi:hypothetical protein